MQKYKNTRNGFEVKTVKDTEESIRIAKSKYVKCLICNKLMYKAFFAKCLAFGNPPVIIDDSVPDNVFYVNGKF